MRGASLSRHVDEVPSSFFFFPQNVSKRVALKLASLRCCSPLLSLSLSDAATLLLILCRGQLPAVDLLIDGNKRSGQEEGRGKGSGGGRRRGEMTSLAFASMEVAGGHTVGFKGHGQGAAAASPAAAYVGARELFDRVTAATGGVAAAARRREEGEEDRAESSESSSIGVGGESSLSLSSSSTADADRGDGEEEVQSELKKEALGSLASLEECLPIKRGLSNCFAGKSKSFASLSEAAVLGSARGLAKPENPFNKRRRILMACKASWQRRASYAALNTSSLLTLEEDEDEDEDDDDEEKGGGREGCDESPVPPPLPTGRKLVSTFRSPRSFSLTDLQHA